MFGVFCLLSVICLNDLFGLLLLCWLLRHVLLLSLGWTFVVNCWLFWVCLCLDGFGFGFWWDVLPVLLSDLLILRFVLGVLADA